MTIKKYVDNVTNDSLFISIVATIQAHGAIIALQTHTHIIIILQFVTVYIDINYNSALSETRCYSYVNSMLTVD